MTTDRTGPAPSGFLSKLILALPILVMLHGCSDTTPGDPDGLSEAEVADTDQAAAVAANSKLQTDRVVSSEVLKTLQESNPSITDAYFTVNDAGAQVLVISRIGPDGAIHKWTSDPLTDNQEIKKVEAQAAAQGGASSMLIPAMAAAVAGYAIASHRANMGTTQSFSSPAAYQTDREQRTSAYSGYVHFASRSQARASYVNSAAFKATPARVSSQPGVTRGAVAGSGARSAGMSAAGG